MKKAALLRGALVTPSSATLGMSSGMGVGSTYSLLDRAPGWKVFMASTGSYTERGFCKPGSCRPFREIVGISLAGVFPVGFYFNFIVVISQSINVHHVPSVKGQPQSSGVHFHFRTIHTQD